MKFKVGDRVFLKITTLRGSITARNGKKFKSRYVRAFRIQHRERKVAYRADFATNTSKMQEVLHDELIKKKHSIRFFFFFGITLLP